MKSTEVRIRRRLLPRGGSNFIVTENTSRGVFSAGGAEKSGELRATVYGNSAPPCHAELKNIGTIEIYGLTEKELDKIFDIGTYKDAEAFVEIVFVGKLEN